MKKSEKLTDAELREIITAEEMALIELLDEHLKKDPEFGNHKLPPDFKEKILAMVPNRKK